MALEWADVAKIVTPILLPQLFMHYQNWQARKRKEIIDEQIAKDYPPHAHDSHEGVRYPPGHDPRDRYRWPPSRN